VFHEKRVIFTKDNLARRNWNGSKVCYFCNKLEAIQHLFFDCYYDHFLWRVVDWVFGIAPPTSVSHLFGGWSKLGHRKHNLLVLIGASALYWEIWLTRNDFIFNKKPKTNFFAVLFWGTYWLQLCTQLPCLDEYKTSIAEESLVPCFCLLLIGGVSFIISDIRSGSLVFIFDVSL
jgi:hypothetical protein